MTAMRWLFVLVVVVVVAVAVLLLSTAYNQPTDSGAWEYLSLTYRQADDNANGILEDTLVLDDRYRALFPISLCDSVTTTREQATCLENTSADLDLYLNTLSGEGWEVQQILTANSEQGGVEVFLRRRTSATQAAGVLTQLPNRVAAVSTVLSQATETEVAQTNATATELTNATATGVTLRENRLATSTAIEAARLETVTAGVPLTATGAVNATATRVFMGTSTAEAATAQNNATVTAVSIGATQAAWDFATNEAIIAERVSAEVNATVSAIAANATATALQENVLATGQARLITATAIMELSATAGTRYAGATASAFARATSTQEAFEQQQLGLTATSEAADRAYLMLTSTAAQDAMQATLNAAFNSTPTMSVEAEASLNSAFQDALNGAAQIQTLQAFPTATTAVIATNADDFDTVRGSIIGNRVEVWSFVGIAGQEVVITVYGDFGKVVNLYRSVRGTDFLLQTESNSFGLDTPVELRRVLLRDGDYVVEVSGLAGESGDYYFTVEVISD